MEINEASVDVYQKRIKQLEDNLKEYRKDIDKFRREAANFKRYAALLAINNEIEICPECDGCGGFDWDGGHGGGGSVPCGKCEGTGVIKKHCKQLKADANEPIQEINNY